MSIEHNQLARLQNLRSESRFEPNVVYDKLEAINGVNQRSSTATAESSVPIAEHERPAPSQKSQPPSSRRRVETPSPDHVSSTRPPPVNPSTTSPPNLSPAPEPTNPSSSPPRPPRSKSGIRGQGQSAKYVVHDTMLNRIVDREHELCNGTFPEFREYMDSRLERRDPTGEAIIAFLNRATAALERYGDRLNELHNRMHQQRPNQ
ncbi:uncharacterized protein EV154DRAFT_568807 [Mucor mucedo]|uniref:uncharacterized protein n=1 Tax=Mucor mucedo TaxID=29922 RepID=UPI002220748F|nr:uncharacterized protein EV154DRAFT_568807 [Mucor mucedo]KAI7878990.1 hypothetical protein EV154DRAFT_568807 [Mucor mucedo]